MATATSIEHRSVSIWRRFRVLGWLFLLLATDRATADLQKLRPVRLAPALGPVDQAGIAVHPGRAEILIVQPDPTGALAASLVGFSGAVVAETPPVAGAPATDPAVAFGKSRDGYLVVYRKPGGAADFGDRIAGRFLGVRGQPLGAEQVIGEGAGFGPPAVVADADGTRYLAGWAGAAGVQTRLLGADGEPLGPVRTLAPTAADRPAVAFSSGSGRFMVAYTSPAAGGDHRL